MTTNDTHCPTLLASTSSQHLPATFQPTPEHYHALFTRCSSANNSFIYGATTTRIFCRPTCPGRLARPANWVFFVDIAAAQNAGYRACKRCEPCDASWHRDLASERVVKSAITLIKDAVQKGETWSVEGIAKVVGVSSGHLHRLFKKSEGLTPKEFAKGLRDRETPTWELGEEWQSELFEDGMEMPVMTDQQMDALWSDLFRSGDFGTHGDFYTPAEDKG